MSCVISIHEFYRLFFIINRLQRELNLHEHAWFDMSRVVFGQFVLLVLLTLLSGERKRFKICLTINVSYDKNIDFIDDLPANSPDLNPIEYVWESVDRRLRRRPNLPANVNELRQALSQEWNNIPETEMNTFVNSIRRRCTAVVNSRGGHTRH